MSAGFEFKYKTNQEINDEYCLLVWNYIERRHLYNKQILRNSGVAYIRDLHRYFQFCSQIGR